MAPGARLGVKMHRGDKNGWQLQQTRECVSPKASTYSFWSTVQCLLLLLSKTLSETLKCPRTKNKAQKGYVPCSRSHSQAVAKVKLELSCPGPGPVLFFFFFTTLYSLWAQSSAPWASQKVSDTISVNNSFILSTIIYTALSCARHQRKIESVEQDQRQKWALTSQSWRVHHFRDLDR